MALVLRQRLRDRRGQTVVEWLLLTAMVFIVAYVVMSGPMSTYTRIVLADMRSRLVGVIQNGDNTPGEVALPGTNGHPLDDSHYKALH